MSERSSLGWLLPALRTIVVDAAIKDGVGDYSGLPLISPNPGESRRKSCVAVSLHA